MIKRIKYLLYRYKNIKNGFKYFNYKTWMATEEKKARGNLWIDEYGGIHNILFKN
jgi:hypothetical protein